MKKNTSNKNNIPILKNKLNNKQYNKKPKATKTLGGYNNTPTKPKSIVNKKQLTKGGLTIVKKKNNVPKGDAKKFAFKKIFEISEILDYNKSSENGYNLVPTASKISVKDLSNNNPVQLVNIQTSMFKKVYLNNNDTKITSPLLPIIIMGQNGIHAQYAYSGIVTIKMKYNKDMYTVLLPIRTINKIEFLKLTQANVCSTVIMSLPKIFNSKKQRIRYSAIVNNKNDIVNEKLFTELLEYIKKNITLTSIKYDWYSIENV